MAEFATRDGVRIVFDVRGEGPPVLLLHGFASDARINWERPGVVDELVRAGRAVVSYDARGHGRSDKPHDPAAYADGIMVRDAIELLDRLGLAAVDVVGYSMGAQVAAALASEERRVRRAVLGGIGTRLLLRRPGEERYPALEISEALEATDPTGVTSVTARAFRVFADATKADRLALAALQRARNVEGHVALDRITVPVLVVVGDRDTLVGDAAALAAAILQGRLVVVPGDHVAAVTRPEFTAAVVRFLGEGDQ